MEENSRTKLFCSAILFQLQNFILSCYSLPTLEFHFVLLFSSNFRILFCPNILFQVQNLFCSAILFQLQNFILFFYSLPTTEFYFVLLFSSNLIVANLSLCLFSHYLRITHPFFISLVITSRRVEFLSPGVMF